MAQVQKKSNARLWFLLHGWLALPVWAFLFFVCLTGTIATVSQEIVWVVNPDVRARQPDGDPPLLGYDAVLEALGRNRPEAVVESISRPVKSQFALMVRVANPDATSETLYVNPYTGAIQGSTSSFDFRQFIRAVHGWLLMPFNSGYNPGWYAVSLLAIPMLGSLITGLVVYKRFWRGFLSPRLRFDKGARVFWGDFHRLAGIWSIPFILIIAVTGLWFLIQAVLSDSHVSFSTAGIPAVVAREDVPMSPDGRAPDRLSLDAAAQIARKTFPDLTPTFVSLPSNAYDHINVGGRGNYPLLFEMLSINPYNGKVEWTRRVSDRSGLELFTESMRPLHTGDFAGLWLKLVYFFFGLLLTMMVLSGMLVWAKRTAQATAAVLKRPLPAATGAVTERSAG